MMSRRGSSSGGGASSLGYLFGSDATTLSRPNNRAPPRPQPPPSTDMNADYYSGSTHNVNSKPQQQQLQFEQHFEHEPTGYATPTGYETPTGYHTPGADSHSYGHGSMYNDSNTGFGSGSGHRPGMGGNSYNMMGSSSSPLASPPPSSGSQRNANYVQQTRAAGKVVNDGGGVSLDMSGGSFMGADNNYFRADGQNSGNFITGRPSTRVQAAPGGGSSLGYLFGGA